MLAFWLLISACADETIVYEDENDDLRVEDNQSFLDQSINLENSGVLDILSESKISGKTAKDADEQAGDYPLTLIAQITPPSFQGGENLTASHVHIHENFAYVTYNTVDSDYVGAIDAINVTDPFNPRIVSRLYYTNADINSIVYENGFIYAVGGVDSDKSFRASSNSFVAKIPCSNGFMNVNGGIVYGFQSGHVATDITIIGNQLLVSSGKEGSLTAYDKNSVATLKEIPFDDLRSVASKNNRILSLDASVGVSVFDLSLNLMKEISITSNFGEAVKRTLDFSEDRVYVSEGAKGAGIYNINTGELMNYIPILINPQGSNANDNVTNAVALNEEVILMANGGAGLSLSEESSETGEPVGIIDLEGSINFVASKGDYIFAASGTAGLQIIKMNKPSLSLVNRCIDLPTYRGSANLNVNSGDVFAFSGAKSLNNLNVNGALLLCGSWTVRNTINVNSNGIFEMNGALIVGNNNNRKNVTINRNAVVRLEQDVVIYGDLILNDGAALEFLGNNTKIYIAGSVRKASNVVIKGSFEDLANKF